MHKSSKTVYVLFELFFSYDRPTMHYLRYSHQNNNENTLNLIEQEDGSSVGRRRAWLVSARSSILTHADGPNGESPF